MARLSAVETGKKLLAEVQKFGGKLWRFSLKILRPLGKSLKVGFNWLWDQGEKIYGRLEKRFAPVLHRWGGSVGAWWERRGWPPSLGRLLLHTLFYLPVDSVWYLFACIEHFVRFNPPYLLAWLVFAGSVRAWNFVLKEVLPDRRKATRVGTAENGTPIEGGC